MINFGLFGRQTMRWCNFSLSVFKHSLSVAIAIGAAAPWGQYALAEPQSNYYLLSGPTAAGGARAGMGATAGVFFSSCPESLLCTGFAQMVGHTARKNSVTYAETLAGYHVAFLGGFSGVGIRTAEHNVLIGHFTYGVGIGPVTISIRRYNENSKPYTEAVLSALWPLRLN